MDKLKTKLEYIKTHTDKIKRKVKENKIALIPDKIDNYAEEASYIPLSKYTETREVINRLTEQDPNFNSSSIFYPNETYTIKLKNSIIVNPPSYLNKVEDHDEEYSEVYTVNFLDLGEIQFMNKDYYEITNNGKESTLQEGYTYSLKFITKDGSYYSYYVNDYIYPYSDIIVEGVEIPIEERNNLPNIVLFPLSNRLRLNSKKLQLQVSFLSNYIDIDRYTNMIYFLFSDNPDDLQLNNDNVRVTSYVNVDSIAHPRLDIDNSFFGKKIYLKAIYQYYSWGEKIEVESNVFEIDISEKFETFTNWFLSEYKPQLEPIQVTSPEVVDFDSSPKEVEETDDWTPEPDWYDIEAIVSKDNPDYPTKFPGAIIALIDDTSDEISLKNTSWGRNGYDKIVLSDGKEWNSESELAADDYKHIWDKTKDKECSKGYKTRWICYYFGDSYFDYAYHCYQDYYTPDALYVIYKNIYSGCQYSNTNWSNVKKLQAIKMIENKRKRIVVDTNTTEGWVTFRNLESLKSLTGGIFQFKGRDNYPIHFDFQDSKLNSKIIKKFTLNYYNTGIKPEKMKIKLGNLLYNNCIGEDLDLQDFYYIPISKIYNLGVIKGPHSIAKIDFENITQTTNGGCQIEQIDEIVNIKSSTNWFSNNIVPVDLLVKVINALYDYSNATEEEKSTEHKLTLGTTNLAKLTDEQKQIAINKGWKLA